MIDYLIVGAGITGATLARELHDAGKQVLVIDKRYHIGGNCHDEKIGGAIVSRYGGHIFHTNARRIWDYVNRFAEWQQYEHRVKVSYKGRVYSFPPNLMTYSQLGLKPGPEADAAIRHLFFEGYTAKQWGKAPADVPASVTSRIPFRHTWDDRYFDDRYQGLPVGGYTALIGAMLHGIPVELERRVTLDDFGMADRVIYTGPLDELYGCDLGALEYRSLRFETMILKDFDQGCATMNYADIDVPYTRIMQWKYFWRCPAPTNIFTREYPMVYNRGEEPYYPIEQPANRALHAKYAARLTDRIIPAGRLAEYRYINMDQAIGAALTLAERLKR